MTFSSLFKQTKPKEIEKTPAKKLLILVQELLNRELPHHQSQHHILFTANTRINVLQESIQQHRKHINHEYKLGQYHQKIYVDLQKQISDIQGLVDSYMELQIDEVQMNHRLHFHHHSIEYLFDNYSNKRFFEMTDSLFWHAMKEDVLHIVRSVF